MNRQVDDRSFGLWNLQGLLVAVSLHLYHSTACEVGPQFLHGKLVFLPQSRQRPRSEQRGRQLRQNRGLGESHFEAWLLQRRIVGSFVPEGSACAVGPHKLQHESSLRAPANQRVLNCLAVEHLGQVRKLSECADEILDPSRFLAGAPEVVGPIGK